MSLETALCEPGVAGVFTIGQLFEPLLKLEGNHAANWVASEKAQDIAVDSRLVKDGTVFFAREGLDEDGIDYVDDALARGATAVVVDRKDPRTTRDFGVPTLWVSDVSECLGQVAHCFFSKPSAELNVVGITGTNGKTSVAHYVAEALNRLGESCGVIGTLGADIFPRYLSRDLNGEVRTTPDTIRLHKTLRAFRTMGAHYAIMEVSSHGLAQRRAAGVRFRCAALTNLSRDHLDYHDSEADYRAAKASLFSWPGLESAVLNANDSLGAELLRVTPAHTLAYGLDIGQRRRKAERWMTGQVISSTENGLKLAIDLDGLGASMTPGVLGRFNAENLLASAGILVSLGVPFVDAVTALESATPAVGRMQRLPSQPGAPTVIVDYAHTPDALRRALETLAPLVRGELWCVFGCGGDRDQGKRVLMGNVARRNANRIVVTSDNPRSEPPGRIIDDILMAWPLNKTRVDQVAVEPDRRRAIAAAIEDAGPEDVVLIAGKGHEKYQLIGEDVLPLDDLQIAQAAIARKRSC